MVLLLFGIAWKGLHGLDEKVNKKVYERGILSLLK